MSSPSPSPSTATRCAADLSALLRARNPLIWLVTREEARAERIVIDAVMSSGYVPRLWDCATGITSAAGQPVDSRATDPGQALAEVRDSSQRQVWILRDLAPWLKDPTIVRAVRSLCRSLPGAPRDSARAMVIITPSADVPPELAGHAIVVDVPLPDRSEIGDLIDAAIRSLPEDLREAAAPNGRRDAAIDAALGLTAEEAQSTFARSLISSRTIDPAAVAQEKRRVVSRERMLEWFEPLPGGLDAVGGLELLKQWLTVRRAAFGPAARAYGLPAPKGMLLAGIPGCGKSLTAKAVATAWGMPLLRLDLGALRSKWVGESEGNIRRALKLAETVSPCVLWLDEVEKALAGATQGAADGGVSGDALGVMLSWMQDRAGSVFVVATANDCSRLPPEFLRRFDALFFVDAPTTVERASIVAAALRAHGRDPAGFDCAAVAAATVDFTGAELAALVPAAMLVGFEQGARPITTADLLAEAAATVPQARQQGDKLAALRAWAAGRARLASAPESTAAATDARALDL